MSFLFRWIIRPLLTFILGLVVLAAVGILTVDRLVSNKLLNADFYADIIAEQDTYNRIYDEVMLDDDVRRASGELFPTELVSHEDLVGILRSVVPPEYLRGQVEGVIDSIIEYLRNDGGGPETDNTGQLEIYLELGPALARVKPVAIDYVRVRIDRIPEAPPENPECTPGRVRQIGERYSDLHDEVAAGRTPASIPSIKALPEPCRALIFDAIFGALEIDGFLGSDSILGQRGLEVRVVEGLRELREELRRDIVAGDAKGAMKAAVPALVSPTLDDNIGRVRAEFLDTDGRLELIDLTGEQTAAEIRAEVEQFRSEFRKVRKLTRTWGIGLLIGAILLMLLVHLPNVGRGLRRAGVSLVIAGLVYLGIAKLLQSIISRNADGLLNEVTSGQPDIPESLMALIGDILVSFTRSLTTGLNDVAWPTLIAGAAVFAASFFIPIGRRLVAGSGE